MFEKYKVPALFMAKNPVYYLYLGSLVLCFPLVKPDL